MGSFAEQLEVTRGGGAKGGPKKRTNTIGGSGTYTLRPVTSSVSNNQLDTQPDAGSVRTSMFHT